MYAAVAIFVVLCIGATTLADNQQPCHSPNMTGVLSVCDFNGTTAVGDYMYDSVARKLRFKTNIQALSSRCNATELSLDVLMFFKEGLFYEINSRNQSCEKKSLQSVLNPLEVPSDTKMLTQMTLGSPTVAEDGLKLNIWAGMDPETKANLTWSVSMGCLPVSTLYKSEAKRLLISHFNTETEIKDPGFLTLPSFCEGVALEEPSDGTVNSFFNLFP